MAVEGYLVAINDKLETVLPPLICRSWSDLDAEKEHLCTGVNGGLADVRQWAYPKRKASTTCGRTGVRRDTHLGQGFEDWRGN